MLFKLSIKNMKKSFKDYAIYFLTLVLGVAIFYMFNSLDSQEAMLQVSSSTRDIIKLMVNMLGYVSVFVAVVLGLLIVYANNFLINRRKKEFGIYMTLGMGKRQISKIILMETILVGIISLIVGLIIGIFASQFMSVLVAKMFEADMSKFQFVFSKDACIKTCIYFAVMYVAVMFFNTFTISRYKLINLLNATKKNESIKIKKPVISILVFLFGAGILGYAYWKVTGDVNSLTTADKILPPILMGIVGTISIFWALSGFVIQVAQKMKSTYLKDTNMFVLRQINNKINTTIISMSVICLMLFMTISILSVSLSLRNTMQRELADMTPVDLNLSKTANLPESYTNRQGKVINYTKEQIEDSKISIEETLKNNGLDMSVLKDVVEIPIYTSNDLTWEDFFGEDYGKVKAQFPKLDYGAAEAIVKISDYNKIAKLYGTEQYELKDDEYIVLCDYDNMAEIRNQVLNEGGHKLTIAGKEYKSKYANCKNGYIEMAASHINTGIILVPDNCPLTEDMKEKTVFVANYNVETDEEKEEIEKNFADNNNSILLQNLDNKGIDLDGITKIVIIQSSVGVASIVTFIAIYLGIIFLIASAAILALKQLTESSDNKQRYLVLRKIGCDEKMINKALFSQIAIFFGLPLILAIIHSIFGIQFAMTIMAGLAKSEDLLPSIIATVIIIGIIYGAYFLATYLGSKNIIKEEE
ncbi:MAG: ABC transporter permease [Clostridia bacterium]|jgi:ABC-type transport system, involved in lipoprotein release, permease component